MFKTDFYLAAYILNDQHPPHDYSLIRSILDIPIFSIRCLNADLPLIITH